MRLTSERQNRLGAPGARPVRCRICLPRLSSAGWGKPERPKAAFPAGVLGDNRGPIPLKHPHPPDEARVASLALGRRGDGIVSLAPEGPGLRQGTCRLPGSRSGSALDGRSGAPTGCPVSCGSPLRCQCGSPIRPSKGTGGCWTAREAMAEGMPKSFPSGAGPQDR